MAMFSQVASQKAARKEPERGLVLKRLLQVRSTVGARTPSLRILGEGTGSQQFRLLDSLTYELRTYYVN